jgi:hypothetical protein
MVLVESAVRHSTNVKGKAATEDTLTAVTQEVRVYNKVNYTVHRTDT